MAKFTSGLLVGAVIGAVVAATVTFAILRPPTVICDNNHYIVVNSSTNKLPDTCSNKAAIVWQNETGSGDITITIPDWNGHTPTTTINPYPSKNCTGATCNSGPYTTSNIPSDTAIDYSLTFMTNGRKIYGHIIIKP
jgi:hypothetical protein